MSNWGKIEHIVTHESNNNIHRPLVDDDWLAIKLTTEMTKNPAYTPAACERTFIPSCGMHLVTKTFMSFWTVCIPLRRHVETMAQFTKRMEGCTPFTMTFKRVHSVGLKDYKLLLHYTHVTESGSSPLRSAIAHVEVRSSLESELVGLVASQSSQELIYHKDMIMWRSEVS